MVPRSRSAPRRGLLEHRDAAQAGAVGHQGAGVGAGADQAHPWRGSPTSRAGGGQGEGHAGRDGAGAADSRPLLRGGAVWAASPRSTVVIFAPLGAPTVSVAASTGP